MSKKVLVALPPAFLEQVDFIAQVEHRTRSDLIRESLRRYLEAFKTDMVPTPAALPKASEEPLPRTDSWTLYSAHVDECKCHFCTRLEVASR